MVVEKDKKKKEDLNGDYFNDSIMNILGIGFKEVFIAVIGIIIMILSSVGFLFLIGRS